MAAEQGRAKRLWVVAELNGQLFGFNCQDVREMLRAGDATSVPGAPAYVRGMVNLRGRALPVVDLRKRMNMPSAQDEVESLCRMLEDRAGDHRRWLAELESCVEEHREFKLATDPHKCAFGQWYDTFKTDSVMLAGVLKRFDAPHQRLHAFAVEVLADANSGRIEEARSKMAEARSGALARMLALFQEAASVLREARREMAIVLEGSNTTFAVIVDSIVAVEPLAEGSLQEIERGRLGIDDMMMASTGRRSKTNELLMTLYTDRILEQEVLSELSPLLPA